MENLNEQNMTESESSELNNNGKNDKKEKTPFTRGLLEQLELIVIFFAVIVLIFSFMCKSCIVEGDSMLNTLHDQERVIIWDAFYTPQYQDIVVVHDTGDINKPIVKRVIGLPGDEVTVKHFISSMLVTVKHSDGTIDTLQEDYITYDVTEGNLSYYPQSRTYKVGEGEVFVMGDNRLDSLDSRTEGCYDERQILGKVVFRIMPFDKIGTVN